ncbi:MAG: bifunctional serine/threonine-protein kinase/formylglycine-generating enzyme family protein [Planctomycetota bacterium]
MTTHSGVNSPDDTLFDRYLEAAEGGDPPDPARFLADAGVTDPELESRLNALARTLRKTRSAASESESGTSALPFERIGNFRLLRRLGRGGMGLVFEAVDESLGRKVAVKLVRPELAGTPAAAERFEREARVVAGLRHPHIVTLLAAGREGDVRYLVLELLEGRGLDEEIEAAHRSSGAGLPVADVVRFGSQIARALQYAHDHDLVHRDVKPSNIRITPEGNAMLLDFGIARSMGSELSVSGAFLGSLPYASPEHVSAHHGSIDGRADVYSLGATLYEAITGRRPFDAPTTERLMNAILHDDPKAPRDLVPGLPRDVQTVLLKALEKDLGRRYASAAMFADDLDALLAFRPISAIPPTVVARSAKWLRRNPAPTGVLATALVATVVIAGLTIHSATSLARETKEKAAGLVREAENRIRSFEQKQADLKTAETQVGKYETMLESSWMTPEQDRSLEQYQAEVGVLRRERTAFVYETLELLRTAQQLDPSVSGLDLLRARIYLTMWHDAERKGDADGREAWARLVRQADPGGSISAALEPMRDINIQLDTQGARIDVFKTVPHSQVVEGGEQRLVPVPIGNAKTPVAPGTYSLRVVRANGDLRAGDEIVELAGFPLLDLLLLPDATSRLVSVDGRPTKSHYDLERVRDDRAGRPTASTGRTDPWAPASRPSGAAQCVIEFTNGKRENRSIGADVLEEFLRTVQEPVAAATRGGLDARIARDGVLLTVKIPPGTDTRFTGVPLLPTDTSRVLPGKSALPVGSYLFLVRAEGFESLRVPVRLLAGKEYVLRFRLLHAKSAPEGFIYIDATARVSDDIHNEALPPFWIAEREVTCAEWDEFLHDPDILPRVKADGSAGLLPRSAGLTTRDVWWKRDASGRYLWPDDWQRDWPIMGISLEDARVYAEWKSARAAKRGERWHYSVPTFPQWHEAAGSATGRTLVYGDQFRPKWSNSCFARPLANPIRAMSFPIDESVYGVFDMGGNVFEWCDSHYDETRSLWRAMGGAWGRPNKGFFTIWGGFGLEPMRSSGETGLRLVATERR